MMPATPRRRMCRRSSTPLSRRGGISHPRTATKPPRLGIPESGDGKSDLLQEAKIEADFLAKMQDSDGGFYFLVYPRDRKYEDNVLPDHGDPQIVFPKTTAATAAAVAAL